MSARDTILASVRRSLDVAANDGTRLAAARERLAARPRHLTPSRVAGKDQDTLVATFKAYLTQSSATVVEIDDLASVPQAVADYLRANNLPPRLHFGDDADLSAAPWADVPTLEVDRGRAEPRDETGVSRALAGVAETGTLVLASGADNPVTLNFMPETHVVVVRRSEVVAAYEDAFVRVRSHFGEDALPRTINMISGPSRTGDIGGRIVMGAHGPRRMCVIVVAG